MVKLSQLMVDRQASEKGAWFPYELGVEALIARVSNLNAEKLKRQLVSDYMEAHGGKRPDAEAIEEIARRVVSQTVLLGWKGIDDEKGKQLPYSSDKAYEVLSNPDLVDFYNWVLQIAATRDNYRRKQKETAAGNSRASSNGT